MTVPARVPGWPVRPVHPAEAGPSARPTPAAPAAVIAGGAALLAVVVALVAVGAAPDAAPAGLRDPGAVVRWGVPAGRLLLDVCAVLTIGGLLVDGVLRPGSSADGSAAARTPGGRARRSASRWGTAWAAAASVLTALTVWDVTGHGPSALPADQLLAAAWVLSPTRALLLVTALALVVPVVLRWVPGRAGAIGGLVVAVVALTPPLYVGHSAHVAGDEVATGALVVHVVAASVWLGGLAGLALHVRAGDGGLSAAADRFSAVALGAFLALVLSGSVVGAASLGTSPTAWTSGYAVLLGVKVVGAVALGLVGWTHRRWTLARLRAGQPRAFLRLVAAELVLMGATAGVAVALSRTPGASSTGLLERPVRAVGPGGVAERLSLGDLVVDWRPEPVLSTAVIVALVARRRWRRPHGPRRSGSTRREPAGRPVALAAGAVLLIATLGLPTRYDGHPLVGVQGVQVVVLLFAVPALLAAAMAGGTAAGVVGGGRGGPAGGVPAGHDPSRHGPRWSRTRWSRTLTDPASGFVAVLVAVVMVLASPLRVTASSGPGRVLTLALLLAGGAVFAVAVWGVGPPAGARQAVDHRAPVLTLTVLFLAAFGALLASGAAGAGAWTAADLSDPAGLGPAGDPRAAGWVLCVSAGLLAVGGGAVLRRQRPQTQVMTAVTGIAAGRDRWEEVGARARADVVRG